MQGSIGHVEYYHIACVWGNHIRIFTISVETNALRFCSVPSPAKFGRDRPTDDGVVSGRTNLNYSMINLLLYPSLECSAP